MEFPVYIGVGTLKVHPHLFFESLAYTGGFLVYMRMRTRRGDVVSDTVRWSVVAAAGVGAAVGARLLFWLEDPWLTLEQWHDPSYLLAGKTIVGGLLGGVVAVEGVKRWLGVTTRTGDLFAVPLTLGIAMGRVGCFLTGLADGTFGNPTNVWTGVNFGDGVLRHPTQLYEIVFLVVLGCVLLKVTRTVPQAGDLFKVFMISYLGFRLVVDEIKPAPVEGFGLSAIQWACLAGLLYYLPDMRRWGRSLRTIDRSGDPHA